jgi:LmbE family N-acetylglucosaminyl deacetylase
VTDLYPDLRPRPDVLPLPGRALAIGAHPDDAEFGAAGTLAKWARAGTEVTIAVVTDGSKGTWDPSADPAMLVATRRSEQRAAAAVIGASGVRFGEHIDGELEYSMDLRAEMCRWIRELRPDVVLTHDPWQRYQLHPDHRVTGIAVIDGIVAARDPHFFPAQAASGLAPHRPGSVLLWSPDEPDHWEDVSTTLETKIDALLRHESQSTTTMGGAAGGAETHRAFADRIRERAAQRGAAASMAAAEAFRRLTP